MYFRYNILITDNINRQQIIKWAWNLHNEVNDVINKDVKISINDAIKLNKRVRNKEIFNFLNSIVNGCSNNMSFDELLSYLTFFKTLSFLYPCHKTKKKLKSIIDEINNIGSGNEFKLWYNKNKKKWQS